MKTTVLVVDDEAQIRGAVRHALEHDAWRVAEATTGRKALDTVAANRADVIVLDLGLPDLDGIEVCREIRTQCTVPIVILSARDADREKIDLLDAGADDYVTKPFSTDELRARVRARLRRSQRPLADQAQPLAVDGLVIDIARHTAVKDDVELHLTPIEWKLLRVFLANRGRALTHSQLVAAVWHHGDGDPQLLASRTRHGLPQDGYRWRVAEFVLSSAARRPRASLMASSFAQKCMKKSRGSSINMWLCRDVT